MKDNLILDKSFNFSIRVVKLYKYLCENKKEYVLSKQLVRSGTSIGANINEAQAGQSKADFIAKMCIASKEARETKYWINLLIKTDYLDKDDKHVQSIVDDIDEIVKLLTSIIKSCQNKI
ncbi:four helix bundle protein [Francisella philomiragia]|uniref:Four helix bundle protein n=1 Tax=Francisella philomiragia TaxID=28110 RepID=A0ABS1G9E6_9GAMM|nr:four helix bundle protein [Francisella philomiragia]MBK2257752.1 four helix bundle protein [Francisella philomiragia]MBK2301440.1 four helix bundle protein [Francisella philomiragia]MBY7734755.1 four helix bundle protein [Francisella philomiragia]